MTGRKQIFISSVQKEFADERRALKEYVHGDPLLRRFFEVFLFEDLPALDRRADEVYLNEVERSPIYVGLFGNDYGYQYAKGVSPTEREFDYATNCGSERLIFIKGNDDSNRHPKMLALIRKGGDQLIRRRFSSIPELTASLYAALVQHLEVNELVRNGPFDAAPCQKASLADLDEEKIRTFLRSARGARGFVLAEDTQPLAVLEHLNLLNHGRPSHAAILLFGLQPQRLLLSSEVKCMHFHSTEVHKPIPSYHIFKGTVFDLVDQAVDFVMSKIDLWVGTRKDGPTAPVEYEIPREVVAEAIVNAVAHRDYTSTGSIQVMLFSDRLEIWSPGELRPPMTLVKLTKPHPSFPVNPLIAEPLYLSKYIEKAGSGTLDMLKLCKSAGLLPPEFSMDVGCFIVTIRRKSRVETREVIQSPPESQPESQPESLEIRVLRLLASDPRRKAELSIGLGQKEVSGQLNKVVRILLGDQAIEYTIPDKPTSRLQKYRLTTKGKMILESMKRKS
jgi:ATP-dependent DNA helicase RecG